MEAQEPVRVFRYRSAGSFGSGFGIVLIIVGIVTLIAAPEAWPIAAAVFVFGSFLTTFMVMMFRNARIEVTETCVRAFDPFGKQRVSMPLNSITAVTFRASGPPAGLTMCIVKGAGRSLAFTRGLDGYDELVQRLDELVPGVGDKPA